MAHSFFTEVVKHCSALIDLHTGSLNRTNLPQVRADLRLPQVARMTQAFGATVVLHSVGERGSLRRAATEAGIPSVTFEMGEPMRVQPEQVEHGAKAVETLLYSLGMTSSAATGAIPEPVYYASKWVRVDHGGILFSDVALGERVSEGELLGVVTDPISNQQHRIYAPISGRVLGMALNQVVLPGFAAYRIGTATSKSDAAIQSRRRCRRGRAGRRSHARRRRYAAARLSRLPAGEPVEKLTFTGFLLRAAFALALVLLTYNPSGYSYVHMLQAGFPAITPLEAVLGVVLLIGWFVFLARHAQLDRAARHGAGARAVRCAHLAHRVVGLGEVVRHRRDPVDRRWSCWR